MKQFFAPMEGLTDRIFRKVHYSFYPGIHSYYMPFISPTIHHKLTSKEQREIPDTNKVSYNAVPQIMTKNAEDFLWAAHQCADRGYTEINLNAGCPSGTVFSKGKGSGMLSDPDALDAFLDVVCAGSPIPVSVKTRIGVHSCEEFEKLLNIYNSHPISTLIIHPRVREQYYKGTPDRISFSHAFTHSRIPLCYNGDIFGSDDIQRLYREYPSLSAVMIGRGLIRYPGMLSRDKNINTLEAYHDELFHTYVDTFENKNNAMHRMKEHWFYLLTAFPGSERIGKQLRKSTKADDFLRLTHEIFHSFPYCPE